jgi:hypothetical protein
MRQSPERGMKPFAIMKCLPWRRARKSHPSLRAHPPRAPGAFPDERVTVHIHSCITGLHAHGKQRRHTAAHDAGRRSGNRQVIFQRVLTMSMEHRRG